MYAQKAENGAVYVHVLTELIIFLIIHVILCEQCTDIKLLWHIRCYLVYIW